MEERLLWDCRLLELLRVSSFALQAPPARQNSSLIIIISHDH